MREIIPNSIAPTSENVIVESIKKTEHAYHIEQKSFEEVAKYLAFNVPNKKHKNGRIYFKMDENGHVVANTASPYSNIFNSNIEDKIEPLVSALRKKRYLTYSSCQGHELRARRFVGLALKEIYGKPYKWDEYTKILANHINSEDFPVYRM